MSRKRIPLEAYNPLTLWPDAIYDGFTAAAEAGHDRRSIDRCLKGQANQHHGYGWRKADAVSRLPDFLERFTTSGEGEVLAHEVADLLRRWTGNYSVDGYRVREIMANRYEIRDTVAVELYRQDGEVFGRGIIAATGIVWNVPHLMAVPELRQYVPAAIANRV